MSFSLHGVIDRRILINYSIDPDCVKRIIPDTFSVQLVKAKVIGGICLIRLKSMNLYKGASWGVSSENAAHRFGVLMDGKPAVYVQRRDTSSPLMILGSFLTPTRPSLSKFSINEGEGHFDIQASGPGASFHYKGRVGSQFPKASVFTDLQECSDFFRLGQGGYSKTKNKKKWEKASLLTDSWSVKRLETLHIKSSFFDNQNLFPEGSIEFDNALLMENIKHTWRLNIENTSNSSVILS